MAKGDVKKELEALGKAIATDAKKNALPNKDTGALDRSINYEVAYISDEKFNISINEKYYGKFLNSGHRSFKGTKYMDRAVEKNLSKGLDSIIEVMTGEILNPIKTNI
jgi:hypothetical protein